jgi:hypothetical protein
MAKYPNCLELIVYNSLNSKVSLSIIWINGIIHDNRILRVDGNNIQKCNPRGNITQGKYFPFIQMAEWQRNSQVKMKNIMAQISS